MIMFEPWSRATWILLAALAAIVAVGLLGVDRFVAQLAISHEPDGLRKSAIFFGKVGHFTMCIPPVILLLVWAVKRHGSRICLWLVAAELSGAVITHALKIFFGRWRPTQLPDHYGFTFFSTSHKCSSFPSGHTTDAMAVATVLWFVWPRLRPLYVFWVVLMAASRLCALDHFVADVAAGAIVGLCCALLTRRYFDPALTSTAGKI